MKILYNMFFPILLILIILNLFGHKSEELVIFFSGYKLKLSLGFFLLSLFILVKLFHYFTKIFSYSYSLIFEFNKILYRHRQKDLLNKLFLILYYIEIEDKKNLEILLANLKFSRDIKIPENLFYLIKYFGAKYVNNRLIIDPIISNFIDKKDNKTLAIKYLLEEKIRNKDFNSSKSLLSKLEKSDFKFNWARRFDAEIEKSFDNIGVAADKLINLEKNSDQISRNFIKTEIEDLLLDKAGILAESLNFVEAKKHLKKLLDLYPENIEALSLLIELHIRQNNKWRANRLIKKIWFLAPSEKILQQFESNNANMKISAMFSEQKKLLRINNSLTSMMAFAKYFVNLGEFDKAKECLNKIAKKQQSPEYYRLLSEIELKTGGNLDLIKQLVEKSG